MRLGLRAQIVLSLSLIFLLTAPLLLTVTVQLSRRADGLRAPAQTPTGSADAPAGETPTTGDRPADARRTRETDGALGRLLVSYVGLTWVAVIGLAYVLLTLLIVRPLEGVVRSTQSLAGGHADIALPERGPREIARLASTFNDMAAQLRAERAALEQRLSDLQATTEELRSTQQRLVHGEKLATVGRMAAGVAHEIGNPLSAILGMVELMRNQTLEAHEQEEFLARVQLETERIHRIIRDLLDFSRREPELEDDQPTEADLAIVVADAVGLLSPQRQARRIEVDVALPDDLPRLRCRPSRLTQVLLNLLLNAADAIAGAGRIEIRAERADAERVRLSVADDGPGIADDMLDRLFDPFTTSKPVGEGTGLGLAVCYSLVEGMGGEIDAHNRDGGGAEFVLLLPAV